jgi:hypothetical protein
MLIYNSSQFLQMYENHKLPAIFKQLYDGIHIKYPLLGSEFADKSGTPL